MVPIRLVGLLLLLAGALGTKAQLRISVLTCGTGDALYASFGHTAIRITDSAGGTDVVYNYGTFDFADPAFYSKFTLGKLLYFLDKEDFDSFLNTYEEEGRSVAEQVLYLDPLDKIKVRNFLETNFLPRNRAYRYDFLFDNCATRVRDIFPRVLGPSFQYGTLPGAQKMSFRQVVDGNLAGKPWQRFGIDLILGSPVDAQMSNWQAMFLPGYLYTGLQHAQYNGRPLTAGQSIFEGGAHKAVRGVSPVFLVFLALFALVLSVHFIKPLKRFNCGVDIAFLLITGLLGLQLLFMWYCTNHQACARNWNILWAFPPNVFIAFSKRSRLRKYCCILAIGGLVAALIVHFLGVQQLPLKEIAPLLAALLVIYGYYIKDSISQ
ncbi:DUF4105 domain-containing protein [Niabella hirudinis]|uniref:lipoprotein N-acyltransferase Lnb domain-containing protein n=1 Tax=Niabella hirudinis TaxID=1285929 RepID=UPI003EBDD735